MERYAQGRCDSGVSLACATGDHMTHSARPGKPDCHGLCRTGLPERYCFHQSSNSHCGLITCWPLLMKGLLQDLELMVAHWRRIGPDGRADGQASMASTLFFVLCNMMESTAVSHHVHHHWDGAQLQAPAHGGAGSLPSVLFFSSRAESHSAID